MTTGPDPINQYVAGLIAEQVRQWKRDRVQPEDAYRALTGRMAPRRFDWSEVEIAAEYQLSNVLNVPIRKEVLNHEVVSLFR
ncbi:MAG: hypothetical protein OXT06_17530 [Rhodospirillaceae bacterium]|nr:hypothetical protein [Rhodospirillaceae bacterium]